MFGFQHWNLSRHHQLAKTLSGGYVPCGAIVTPPRRAIYQKTFSRMDRCVVHSTTFGRNKSGDGCGLAAAGNHRQENLIENAAKMGAAAHGKNRCVADATFFYQRGAWQRAYDRIEFMSHGVQTQDGLEVIA